MPSITSSYTHEQSTPATTWTIVHNLGTSAPSYHVYIDRNGSQQQVLPNKAEPTDANTLTLTFTTAVSGTARVR